MGGIRTTVKTAVKTGPKVEYVIIDYPRDSNEFDGLSPRAISSTTTCPAIPKQAAKVSEMSSLLGKAGITGFGKAIQFLDSLGSSMTNLTSIVGTSGMSRKENTISILAFEVANTIVKGANLMQSLSEDNVRHLKEVVLPSKGVQTLISRDMDELLRIAAADKREELKTFSSDVVRFGNYSKDLMWHNLDLYFKKIGSKVTQQKHFKRQAQEDMEQLMTLIQSTAELCYELHMLDRLEQDYQRRLKGDGSNAARRDDEPVESSRKNHKKLGPSGISLHYASIITQINTLVSLSRSSSVPQHMRDTLYQGLPSSVKSALRSKLQLVELTVPQIKTEMKKTLEWLVPIASNTTKALHSFGWVGEWANSEFGERWKHGGQTGILRIETLHHADKAETEACIFKLVVWLQHLISQSGASDGGMPSTPVKTLNQKTNLLSRQTPYGSSPVLTDEDQEMLQDVSKSNLRLRMSRSQNHASRNAMLSKQHRLSKSSRDFLSSKTRKDPFPVWSLLSRPIDFDNDRIKLLDVIDGVDTIKGSN
ncbi:protein PSK SIMULATOR 1-like isoform X2 [Prunus dulcis]|uniref:protein PSK SIMULATOR 1-like isoform X2 n=1 Tax=Prunus dulcis TaxID=3755 RepID=UPI0014832862|nr:protein PSK SIMULATOR 1-like isoform X2 [Prunus dulcis]XP_034197091.1 protein PSK SIMULATOR 1-like isoform X2 [Prunus dulcis]